MNSVVVTAWKKTSLLLIAEPLFYPTLLFLHQVASLSRTYASKLAYYTQCFG